MRYNTVSRLAPLLVVLIAACGSSGSETFVTGAPNGSEPPDADSQPSDADSPDVEGAVPAPSPDVGSADSADADDPSGADSESPTADRSDAEDPGYASAPDTDSAAPDDAHPTDGGSSDDTASTSRDDPAPPTTAAPLPPAGARQPAYINDVAFRVMESFPMQVVVEVSGDLPDPCHTLWWEVVDDGSTYEVSVWSVDPPADTACAAVLEPFTANIPLGGGFVFDDYTVVVNGTSYPLSL